MKSVTRNVRNPRQKQFCEIFDSLCGQFSRWEIWSDFVVMSAIAISNTVDHTNAKTREEAYKKIASKYKSAELERFAEMLATVVTGMDNNTDQDFLGELYMSLELGNDHAGQFFTPYSVCRCMAEITSTDLKARIERDGWISVNDPTCGAGALLVAFANDCRRQDINFQTSVLFTAQDIDYTVGLMCYLQLSILGCPGYVTIADTLANPQTSLDRRGLLPRPGENILYTLFYFRDIWQYRRIGAQMDLLFSSVSEQPEQVTGKLESPSVARTESAITPEKAELQQITESPAVALKETTDGQLTLF